MPVSPLSVDRPVYRPVKNRRPDRTGPNRTGPDRPVAGTGYNAGLAIGALADLPRFQRSLKLLLLVNLSISFLFCLLFQLSVNTVLWPNRPPLPSSDVSIGILLSLVGLFSGAASPLIFECLAEMMHPLPESLTASIYVQFYNIFSLIFVAIAPGRFKLMNLFALLAIAATIGMVACARVTYKRKDQDENVKSFVNFSYEDTANL